MCRKYAWEGIVARYREYYNPGEWQSQHLISTTISLIVGPIHQRVIECDEIPYMMSLS